MSDKSKLVFLIVFLLSSINIFPSTIEDSILVAPTKLKTIFLASTKPMVTIPDSLASPTTSDNSIEDLSSLTQNKIPTIESLSTTSYKIGSFVLQTLKEFTFSQLEFFKFFTGVGNRNHDYQNDYTTEALKSSPGVLTGINKLIEAINSGQYKPGTDAPFTFSYEFSPSPSEAMNSLFRGASPMNKSQLNAHLDAIKSLSAAKLFVGGYEGTLRIINANTVQVTLTNQTSANSLFLHIGSFLKEQGIIKDINDFNDFFNCYFPLFHSTKQVFQFLVPIRNTNPKL